MSIARVRLVSTASRRSPLWFRPALLRGENADEYEAMLDALAADIKPRGPVEEMYVCEMASIVWDIRRLHRAKVGIIRLALFSAVRTLIKELTGERAPTLFDDSMPSEEMARRYFDDRTTQREVLEILAQFGLDDCAIEAEAIRQSADRLELIEKMSRSLEARRDRALACIAAYRDSFARQVQESSRRLIESEYDNHPILEQPVNTASGAERGKRTKEGR